MARKSYLKQSNEYMNYKQKWVVAISETQDARFVLFGDRHQDEPTLIAVSNNDGKTKTNNRKMNRNIWAFPDM